MNRTHASLLVMAGSLALLQFHGIQFWVGFVGASGAAWSLLLETVSLWLWWQPQWTRRALGLLASVLLLAGPLHEVSKPIFTTNQAAAMAMDRLEGVSKSVSQLETLMETYRRNSESRMGWLSAIQDTQQRLDAARQEEAELMATGYRADWRGMAVIAMQAVALVLFQVTAILALRSLAVETAALPRLQGKQSARRSEPQPERKREMETMETPRIAVANGSRVRELVGRLDSALAEQGVNQATWAKANGVAPRDLSLLRNHEERAARNERTCPPKTIRRIEAALSVTALSVREARS